jgi:hypothetical protein
MLLDVCASFQLILGNKDPHSPGYRTRSTDTQSVSHSIGSNITGDSLFFQYRFDHLRIDPARKTRHGYEPFFRKLRIFLSEGLDKFLIAIRTADDMGLIFITAFRAKSHNTSVFQGKFFRTF